MLTTLAGLMNSHSLTEFDGFEIFNVDATRKTKIFDKKTVLWCFCPYRSVGAERPYDLGVVSILSSGRFTEDSFRIVEKVVDAVD